MNAPCVIWGAEISSLLRCPWEIVWDTFCSKNLNSLPNVGLTKAQSALTVTFFFSEINSKDIRDSTTVSDLHRDGPLRYWVTRVECILWFRYCVISSSKSHRHVCQSRVCPLTCEAMGLLHRKGPFCPCNIIYQKSSTRMPVRGVSVQRVRPWGYYIEKVPFVLVISSFSATPRKGKIITEN